MTDEELALTVIDALDAATAAGLASEPPTEAMNNHLASVFANDVDGWAAASELIHEVMSFTAFPAAVAIRDLPATPEAAQATEQAADMLRDRLQLRR